MREVTGRGPIRRSVGVDAEGQRDFTIDFKIVVMMFPRMSK